MPEHVENEHPAQLGDFRIHALLGSGGSGQVFEASWGPRRVALKVLRSDLLPNDAERNRFFSEAQHLAELGHPGIVKILSYGALPDGRPYLVMELLTGEVLARRLGAEPLGLETALHYFYQIASAVEAIHARGLIHRDLKPENVMIAAGTSGEPEGYAILLDFGIAKSLDAPASTTTQEGGVRGTPAYMAPERFFGQPASIASDIYELSVTLYALVTCALPWDSGFDPEARLNPRPPSERGAQIPLALETLIMRGLSTRAEQRPSSVSELVVALKEATGSIGVAAAPRTTAAIAPRSGLPPTRVDAYATTGHSGRHGLEVGGGERTSATVVASARSLWPLWIAGGVVACAVGAAAALWPSGGDTRTAASGIELSLTPAEQPENARLVETGRETGTPTRSGDDAGFFTASKYHPADTAVLLGLRARQLRQSEAFAKIFNEQKTRDPLATVVRATEACGIDIVDDLDWVTLGIAARGGNEVDAILSGSPEAFNRDSVETCLAKVGSSFGAGSKVARDGPVTSLEDGDGPSHLIWLGESTVMLSTRKEADAEWLKARLAGEGSVHDSGPLKSAIGNIDGKATLWLVGRAEALEIGKDVEGVPLPELFWGQLIVSDELALDSTLVYPDVATATGAENKLSSQIDELRSDPIASGFFGKLAVTRTESSVNVVIEVGSAATQMVTRALIDTLKKKAL